MGEVVYIGVIMIVDGMEEVDRRFVVCLIIDFGIGVICYV